MARKLKAVIDTNLFISGLFAKDSLSAQLQDLWINQDFELITSVEIIKEISRVLNYPRIQERFKPTEENIRRFFHLTFRNASSQRIFITPTRSLTIPPTTSFWPVPWRKRPITSSPEIPTFATSSTTTASRSWMLQRSSKK